MAKPKCPECEKKDAEIDKLRKKLATKTTFDYGKDWAYERAIKAVVDKAIEEAEE